MKKTFLSILLVTVLLVTNTCIASRTRIDVNIMDLQANQEDFQNNGTIYFLVEGINITIMSQLTSIALIFTETMERDVTLNFRVSNEFLFNIKDSSIKSSDVEIKTKHLKNETIFSFNVDSLQTVTLTISKFSIITSEASKKVHNFWNYAEYNGVSDGVSDEVSVNIDKNENDFDTNEEQLIVEYKTSFFGWYYPIDKSQYQIEDNGVQLKITTKFNGSSGDIRIHTFTDSSTSLRSSIAKFFVKVQIGIKKVIIDIFGDKTPRTS